QIEDQQEYWNLIIAYGPNEDNAVGVKESFYEEKEKWEKKEKEHRIPTGEE
ncbi:hypothetical protein ILUMI_17308, partial [Ignelater luminosus]